MLIDEVEVKFKAGNGGNGKVSFRKTGRGPDGGNGGRGGDLYIVSSNDLTLLNQFSRVKIVSAEDGVSGGSGDKDGRKGKSIEVYLPNGTSVIDKNSGKEIISLERVGQSVLLCKGGDGGMGNHHYASPTNTTPKVAQTGFPGQEIESVLSLKLIAEFGLIGLPNSGKSSLLNELTGANAKTANYSFTTISPNLGVINGRVIADIPGLIEGASDGRGLGINFLKHIEKVKTLIHCIDSTSDNYERDYLTVRAEMEKYNAKILDKNEIVVLTKSDLVDSTKTFKNSINVSVYNLESIEKLKSKIIDN